MNSLRMGVVYATCLLTGAVGQAQYDDEPVESELGGLLDLRAVATEGPDSWLQGGQGKLRYDDDATAEVGQASILWRAKAWNRFSAHVQANLDLASDEVGGSGRFDLIESFVSHNYFMNDEWSLRSRWGFFFPPVSMEHTGKAWTPNDTITPSAMNSWVGEELRSLGGEVKLSYKGTDSRMSLLGAAYGFNDPAGSLLAYRGWAMNDRQSGYGDKLPLAPLPQIADPDGFFQGHQAPWVEPFREIDDRIGYYTGLSLANRHWGEWRALYYDNRANPTAFDDGQYAWETTFYSTGAWVPLPGGLSVLTQWMSGDTTMGVHPLLLEPAVDVDYEAYYVMAIAEHEAHHFALRYDRFEVKDRDVFTRFDDSSETGDAWTFAYRCRTGEHHSLGVELLYLDSENQHRVELGQAAEATEKIGQLSFRLTF